MIVQSGKAPGDVAVVTGWSQLPFPRSVTACGWGAPWTTGFRVGRYSDVTDVLTLSKKNSSMVECFPQGHRLVGDRAGDKAGDQREGSELQVYAGCGCAARRPPARGEARDNTKRHPAPPPRTDVHATGP